MRGDGTCASAGGGSLPSGLIVMILSGTCPTGFTEVAALSGVTIIGTVAANANVGTTGGSDNITPAGTFQGNAWTPPAIAWPAGVPTHSGTTATFSGTPFSSVINHTHTITATATSRVQGGTTASTTGTHIMTSAATGGSARAPTAGDAISGTTDNPSGGVASITPAGGVNITSQGTIAWPAGVPTIGAYTPAGSFNGTQFDNRSSFVRAIFCQSN